MPSIPVATITTATIATVLLALTGCAPTGTPVDTPQTQDARGVIDRFAAALESTDCAELFATTTTGARTDLGVAWQSADDCQADKDQNAPEGSDVTVSDVVEVSETLTTAELVVTPPEGLETTLSLQVTRASGGGDWLISDVEIDFGSAAPTPQPTPQPSAEGKPDYRDDFLFLAQDFLTALATKDCFAFQIMTTREFWDVFATNAGADDVCDVVENGSTAPWEDVTVVSYGTIDDGTPTGLWGDMVVTYTFDFEGELWDQDLAFGYWHEAGAPGTTGIWKIYSVNPHSSPVPHA